MNDRLGDLGGDSPAWATDTGGEPDIEVGIASTPNQPLAPGNNSIDFSGGADDDEEDFAWASVNDDGGWAGTSGGKGEEEVQQEFMDAFFKDIEKIREDIDAITEASKRIGDMNDKAVMSVSDAEESELSRELTPLIKKTNISAKRTKSMLELLKEENAKFKKEETVKNSDMRIRENLCNTLTRKFIDEMKFYQSFQQKYKSDLKNKAVRQIKMVKPDATPDEIEDVMKNDGGKTEIIQQYVLAGGVNDAIQKTYTDVAGKYQDVITLEQSVAELHQMFLDFALLTMQQGELIDQIEFNVKGAADFIEEANVDVHTAIEYQKKSRKKYCCIIVLIAVLAVVLMLALGLF